MSHDENNESRRRFLKVAAGTTAAAVVMGGLPRFARAADLPHVTDADPTAKALGYVPKPQEAAYEALLALGNFTPQRAALFDDSVRNLVPARARGMTTVWFNNGGGQSHWRVEDQGLHIDHETDDLARFLSGIRIATP